MLNRIISDEIMEFMVWVLEVAAGSFFAGDRALAYNTIKKNDIWEAYINEFEAKKCLSAGAVCGELNKLLEEKGVAFQLPSEEWELQDTKVTLLRQVMRELAVHQNWSYSVSFDRFYNSRVCIRLSDQRAEISALSPPQIVLLFVHEAEKQGPFKYV